MTRHERGVNGKPEFLSGGGEMGALIRAHDWTQSPLGTPAQWPDSLKMTVSICLNSRFPMVLWWGPEFIMLYNDAWRPILGAAKHPKALGSSGIELFPEIWDIIGEQLGGVLKGGEATWSEDLLLAVDRYGYLEEAYFTYSYSPIKAADGRVGGVFTAVSETTERVLSERRMRVLRELAARTAESKSVREACRTFAEVLGENNPEIPFALLYLVDDDGRGISLAASAGLQRSTYHPPGHLALDGNDEWSIARAVRHGEPVVLDDLDLRVGTLTAGIWPEPTTRAIVLPVAKSGQSAGVTGVLVAGINPRRALDIPYRRFFDLVAGQMATAVANGRAYEEERRRSEALAEIDRAKTTFFSNASHEFRTPLSLMLGPLEDMLARHPTADSERRDLEIMHRNGLRLLKLVNTLLDFSRIEAGRIQAVYEPVDLAVYTAEVASVFRSAMENVGLRFSVECQPIPASVYVDRDMWEKVVLNLLSNAFKFTFGGEVAVTLLPVEGAAELQVRDTGVGIPEEHRERVFERFYRIEGTHARTYEGTGIGLALVQELVKLHGGSVRVESALGKGSTFTVTIPSGKAHLPAGRIQAAQSFASTKIRAEAYVEEVRQWSGGESGAVIDVAMLSKSPLVTSLPEPKPAERRELIILADDNADMRQYLGRLLGDRYEVHAVADGRQALEVTRQLRPALVLADVMMPQLDGFRLLRAIRDDSALASTPVIMLSARAGEESRVEGLQAGADDYLVKPFTARELLARVEAHVKLANLRRETVEREERLRSEGELERQKLRASEERLVETSRLYHELQNREAKIRRLVDANIIGIVIWNLDGQIVEANDAFLRMVGYDREDIACSLRWTDLTPPEWRERDERAVAEVTRTGSAHPFEKEYFRKDGSRVPVLIGAALFEASRNEGVAFVLDLSERKRAEEALRDLESNFTHMNRVSMMGELAASLSHEIKQPIAGARIAAKAAQNFLGMQPPELGEVTEALTLIVRDADRAGEIVDRIREQLKKAPPRKERFDLNAAINEVLVLPRSVIIRNGVSVQTRLADGLLPVQGDRVQLQQVVLNLILNAAEAMGSAEAGPRELLIRTEQDQTGVLVAVCDSGPGVDRDHSERIFEAFYTTKSGGTGMGLSICRSIIEAHGGRLWASANVPRGAKFQFTVPAHSDITS